MNPAAENRPKIRKNRVENAIATKMKNSNAKTKRKIANQHLRLCLHLAELVVVMDLLVVLLKNPEVVAEIRNEETRNLVVSELWEVEGPFSITQ